MLAVGPPVSPVVDGELAFFNFDDTGQISETHILGRDSVGVDIQPGVWHSMAVLTEHVVLRGEGGPYLAANDKDFAPWAPKEGDPGARAYLERMVSSVKSV